jgi:outer membrane immunogenic protein
MGYDRPRILVQGFEDAKEEGVLYGVGAGADFAIGPSMALGGDVEATGSNAGWREGAAELSMGRDLYAGARMTFPISSNANVYVKGGYSNLQVTGRLGGLSETETLDGWRIGAGAQIGLGGRAYVGGEVRYSDYERDISRGQLALTLGSRF